MGKEIVTEYETVEKEKEITVCDSCGTRETEIDGDFHTVVKGLEVYDSTRRTDTQWELEKFLSGREISLRHKMDMPSTITAYGAVYDLCPICGGAIFG